MTWKVEWTEERVAFLKEQAERGMSGQEIADAINKRFSLSLSRNSIIGAASRRGVGIGAHRGAARPLPPKRLDPPAKRAHMRRRVSPTAPAREADLQRATLQEPVRDADGRWFTTLTIPLSGRCKWPIGGEGASTAFCGHVTPTEDDSYCKRHRQAASRPWPQNKPQQPRAAGPLSVGVSGT